MFKSSQARLGLCAITLASCLSAQAAVVTLYTTRVAFNVAAGPTTTFDFTGADGTLVPNLGTAMSVNTLGGEARGQINSNNLCGRSAATVNCFLPLVLTSLQPWRAFAYDNLDFTTDEEAVVRVSFANGDLAQVFSFNLGGQAALTPIFFGLTSSVAVSNVQIYSRTIGTTDVGQRANVLDNLSVGSLAAVPEPATFGLLGLGFAAAAWARKRDGGKRIG